MRSWAIEVQKAHYPMHSVVARTFSTPSGSKAVLARTEWHTVQAATGKHGTFWAVSLYAAS